jgi:hypothetical protein
MAGDRIDGFVKRSKRLWPSSGALLDAEQAPSEAWFEFASGCTPSAGASGPLSTVTLSGQSPTTRVLTWTPF